MFNQRQNIKNKIKMERRMFGELKRKRLSVNFNVILNRNNFETPENPKNDACACDMFNSPQINPTRNVLLRNALIRIIHHRILPIHRKLRKTKNSENRKQDAFEIN